MTTPPPRALALLPLWLLTVLTPLPAQVPEMINYQGRVVVGTTNFTGTGQFRFALVNAAGTTAFWTNDGSHLDGTAPTGAVALPVTNGLYGVALGNTALPNMTAIPATVFANSEVYLRVWFDDGANGVQLLTPDQRITSVGYALMAAQLAPGTDIVAGTITANTIITTTAGLEPPTGVTPILNMVWIKPGTFVMGTPATELDRDADEGPETVVTLTDGYWIGHHEVTQGEYLSVMGSNPSQFTGNLNRPVERVSWNSAVAYCAALTTTERAAGRIPANWQYRLPTEAEWEYACRANTTTRFSYGDDLTYAQLPNYAWVESNGGGTSHAYGLKLPNPWGLVDMHGNVFEWLLDNWVTSHPGDSRTNWVETTPGTDRVIHGGSWFDPNAVCRCGNRYGYPATGVYNDVGFRVVLSPLQP